MSIYTCDHEFSKMCIIFGSPPNRTSTHPIQDKSTLDFSLLMEKASGENKTLEISTLKES